MDSKNLATAKVHANIAIIKYWGKKEEKLKIPFNSSISFTLDKFYTKTCIIKEKGLTKDVFYLNNVLQDDNETQKISKVLDHFRNKEEFVVVKSSNSMPTAAGLSSSSSGLAALVVAANYTFNTKKSDSELSYLARLGSGSASRSLFGPFAIWKTSDIDHEAIAYPLDCDLDLSMIILILSVQKKEVLSRDGMKHCVETSSLFNTWVEQANRDAITMQKYMKEKDFTNMGKLMEKNTLLMHETTKYANPPFSYLKNATFEAIELVKEIRKNGIEAYFTMDAGPNVKILCQTKDCAALTKKLLEKYPEEKIVVSKGASNYEILPGDQT